MAPTPDRKRRTREHVIADLSVNHVERFILQCGWSVQRSRPDYGIDLVMDTFDSSGQIENGVVKFQLKATDSLKVLSRRQSIAIRLDWPDVVYYLNEWMPVIASCPSARVQKKAVPAIGHVDRARPSFQCS